MRLWLGYLVVGLIILGGSYAFRAERLETQHGWLRGACQRRVDRAFAACRLVAGRETAPVACAEALLDLELLEDNAPIWRGQWLGALTVALTLAALLPLLRESPAGLGICAFAVAFLAQRIVQCHERSHVRKAPRGARLRLIRGLAGSSSDTTDSHY